MLRWGTQVLGRIVGRIVSWCEWLLDSTAARGARNVARQWHRLDQNPWGEGFPRDDAPSAPSDDPPKH